MKSNSKHSWCAVFLICCGLQYANPVFAVEVAAALQSSTMSATVSSIGNDLVVYLGGKSIGLADITIAENYVGGLKPNAFVAIGSDFDQIISFDISEATLRAYRLSDNMEITSAIIGNNTLIADPAPSKTNIADVVFKIKAGSSPETGPIKIVISDLRAVFASYSRAGQTLKIGGSETSGAGLDTLDKISSNLGSGATAQTLTLRWGAGCPAFAELCSSLTDHVHVSGPVTAQTIRATVFPPSYMINRQGNVFIFAFLPRALGGNIYVMSADNTWTIYTSCETAPAYYSGALLKMKDIPMVSTPTDLTALAGTKIYLGWGRVNADASPGAACREMITHGSFNLMVAIQG